MEYDLELEKVAEKINKETAKNVVIQLPDGLKPHANKIIDYLKKYTKVEHVSVWAGSCYGACDIPMGAKRIGTDLLIHFGHSKWNLK